MKFADLHLHTNFSDSTYTPQQLVEAADKVGLSCIAVVDHDTVAGIAPTLAEAKLKSPALEVLPGIELSVAYRGLEVHILGYLIDYRSKKLARELESLKNNRIERIYKMTQKLKKAGVPLAAEAVFAVASNGTVGRMHVARAMVKEGLVGSVTEAFKRYIGDNCPAYVLGFKLSPPAAIKLIQDSGGIAVLAHPYLIGGEGLLLEIIDYGIRGIEVYYPQHSKAMINSYLRLARKRNLLVTGGSDCHGIAKPEVKIGSVKIPYDLVEKMKKTREKIR